MSDLDSVRSMFSEMKNQFETMRKEQIHMASSYDKAKDELHSLKQINHQYGTDLKKLRNVTEKQKHDKDGIRTQSQKHLENIQQLNSQIQDLKQQLIRSNSREQSEHIQNKISDLERKVQANTDYLQSMNTILEQSLREEDERIYKLSSLQESTMQNPISPHSARRNGSERVLQATPHSYRGEEAIENSESKTNLEANRVSSPEPYSY